MGNEEKKSVFPREKLKDKLRRLYKKHDRKLLEEYNVVDSDSPVGMENGMSMEELTPEGEHILAAVLWAKHRQEVIDILKKVKEADEEDEEEEEKKK